MENATFRKTVLPVLIAFSMLVLFNAGLYLRLSADPVRINATVDFPYENTFVDADALQFPSFGGDWDVRDETLVQISTTGFDLGLLIPMEIAPDTRYSYSVDMRYIGGTMGGGLIFNSQNGQNRQQSHMARFNVEGDQLWVIYGYFGDDSNFTGQGSIPLEITPDNADWQRLGVRINEDSYAITLNDAVLASDIPLEYRGGAIGLNTSGSQVAFDNLAAVPLTENTVPVDDTAQVAAEATENIDPFTGSDSIFVDDFNNPTGGASLWLPFSGTWEFSEGAFVQSQIDGFDLGAGYNQPFGDVTISSTLRHLEGQGAGILFNMQSPDTQWDSHMVRYVHDDDFIFWGYFDAEGSFTGQGSVAVPAPSTDTHTLSIINNGTTYDIALDGAIIAPDIPVVATGDYAGLVAAQSAVAFESFNISNDTIVATEPIAIVTDTPVETGLNLNALTGDWEFGETIIQRETEAVDYIAGTGVAAETFSVSVTILLPDDLEDAGAGLVFHMSGRDEIASGQMIRFGNGGSEIFWGIYDENAMFEGQGGAPVDLDPSIPHRLTLNVRADTYDVLIDDESLVTDLPVRGDFGWIGLISYRGIVEFSDFELSIGQ